MDRKPCITCASCENKHGVKAPRGYCSKECAHMSPAIVWSAEVAYLAGLVASDGCLKHDIKADRFSLGFTSTEPNLVKTVVTLLKRCGITPSVGKPGTTDSGKSYWQVRWTSYPMYNRFLSIGLTPRKSLTMPALQLPVDAEGYSHFWAFFRGVFEGDGSVPSRPSGNLVGVRIISGAPIFTAWLRRQLYLRGIYDIHTFTAAHDKKAEILQTQTGYMPVLYRKMYGDYPQFSKMGHPEKTKRLKSRKTNVEHRSWIRKQRSTRPKMEASIMHCLHKLGRWPNSLEYDALRADRIPKLKDPRNFPGRSCVLGQFGTWAAFIQHMEIKHPQPETTVQSKIEQCFFICHDQLGRWPSSFEYAKIRREQIPTLRFPRDFISCPRICDVMGGWGKAVEYMRVRYPEKTTAPEKQSV